MPLTKNHPLFNAFMSLSCALSPENLSMDGECSIAETRRRYTSLRKQWNKLENKFGRGVSEDEVWAAEMDTFWK